MKIEIQPSQENIEDWIRSYVPEKDLFFLPEKDLIFFEEYLQNVLVIPREEFFEHKSYNQIQLVNSYEYWNISKEVQYVIVASSDWVNSLPAKKKKHLFYIQMEYGRGLIYPISFSFRATSVLKENVIETNEEHFLILQRAIWEGLSYNIKIDLIKEFALQWEDWTCYGYPEKAPLYIKKFANTFPSCSGSNCLSATLFAITQQEWMIYEWVHPRTFIQSLKKANYSLTSSQEIELSDIAIWEDLDGVIQHASYHIGDSLFFNKNGQTYFNPWKIIDFTELKEKWSKYSMSIYRKNV